MLNSAFQVKSGCPATAPYAVSLLWFPPSQDLVVLFQNECPKIRPSATLRVRLDWHILRWNAGRVGAWLRPVSTGTCLKAKLVGCLCEGLSDAWCEGIEWRTMEYPAGFSLFIIFVTLHQSICMFFVVVYTYGICLLWFVLVSQV